MCFKWDNMKGYNGIEKTKEDAIKEMQKHVKFDLKTAYKVEVLYHGFAYYPSIESQDDLDFFVYAPVIQEIEDEEQQKKETEK